MVIFSNDQLIVTICSVMSSERITGVQKGFILSRAADTLQYKYANNQVIGLYLRILHERNKLFLCFISKPEDDLTILVSTYRRRFIHFDVADMSGSKFVRQVNVYDVI